MVWGFGFPILWILPVTFDLEFSPGGFRFWISGFGFWILPATFDLEFSPGGFRFGISDFGHELLEFSPIRPLLKNLDL